MILFSKFFHVASATTFIFFNCYNSLKANETFAWDISLPLIFFQSFDRQREGSALIDGHLFYLFKYHYQSTCCYIYKKHMSKALNHRLQQLQKIC